MLGFLLKAFTAFTHPSLVCETKVALIIIKNVTRVWSEKIQFRLE